MRKNQLHFFIVVFLIFFSTCARSNGDIQDETYPGWARHYIRNYNLIPFSIQLPESYEIRIRPEMPISHHMWSTNEIFYNNRQIGGVFTGTFQPDYVLLSVDESKWGFIPLSIFDSAYQISLFENTEHVPISQPGFFTTDRFLFEACITKHSESVGSVYFHIWGITNDEEEKSNLLKAFSTIKRLE